jgi:hypothetical protein
MAQPEISKSQWERLREATPAVIKQGNVRKTFKDQALDRKAASDALLAKNNLAFAKERRDAQMHKRTVNMWAKNDRSESILKNIQSFASNDNSDINNSKFITNSLSQVGGEMNSEDYAVARAMGDEFNRKSTDPEVVLRDLMGVQNNILRGDMEEAITGFARTTGINGSNVSKIDLGEDGKSFILYGLGADGVTPLDPTPFDLTPFMRNTDAGIQNDFKLGQQAHGQVFQLAQQERVFGQQQTMRGLNEAFDRKQAALGREVAEVSEVERDDMDWLLQDLGGSRYTDLVGDDLQSKQAAGAIVHRGALHVMDRLDINFEQAAQQVANGYINSIVTGDSDKFWSFIWGGTETMTKTGAMSREQVNSLSQEDRSSLHITDANIAYTAKQRGITEDEVIRLLYSRNNKVNDPNSDYSILEAPQ